MRHLTFTRMARNVCRILLKIREVQDTQVDLGAMPLGDLFKTSSFTEEEYELLGQKNTFYSSEYIKKVGEMLKNTGRTKL